MNLKKFYIQFLCLLSIPQSSVFGMYRLPVRQSLPPATLQNLEFRQTTFKELPEQPKATINPELVQHMHKDFTMEQQKPLWTERPNVTMQRPVSGISTGAFRSTPVYFAPAKSQRLMSRQEALKTLSLSEKDLELSAIEDSLKKLPIDQSLLLGLSAIGFRNKPWVENAMSKRRIAKSPKESLDILEAIIVLTRLDNLNHYSLKYLETTFPQLLDTYIYSYTDALGNYKGPLPEPKELLTAAENAAKEVRFRQEAVKHIIAAEAHENVRIMKVKTEDRARDLKYAATDLKERIFQQGTSMFNKAKNAFYRSNSQSSTDLAIPEQNDNGPRW